MKIKDHITALSLIAGIILLTIMIYQTMAHAGVSDGQPVSAAVTNAAYMDKNTTTTFTTALIDAQSGFEVSGVVDSTSTGSNQDVTLTKTLTTFTNVSLASIENLTIANRVDGTLVTITNATGAAITLKNNSGGTAANRIVTGFSADLVVPNNASVNFYYDVTNSRWNVISMGAVPLGTSNRVSGQLAVANGGTGLATITAHGVMLGEGSSNVTPLVGSTGTVLIGTTSSDPSFSAGPVLGASGTTGTLGFSGTSSGTITIQPQSAAGTYNLNLPITAGGAGQVLTSQGGGSTAMTWSTVAGLSAPTEQIFTSTGTQTGWLFTVSTTSTLAVGDTYTNNSNTYTVQVALTAQSGQVLWMSGTGATSGTTLTRSAGAGTASITFSAKVASATYTTPASALFLKVTGTGGGGGGGGTASTAAQAGAGGGGTGGATFSKYITSPGATIPYVIGTHGTGGSTGNNSGNPATPTAIGVSSLPNAGGGVGGGGSAAQSGAGTTVVPAAGGTASGGDLNIGGGTGGGGQTLGTTGPCAAGAGGTSMFSAGAVYKLSSGDGLTATGYGGGGGGGCEANGAGTKAGGDGTDGLLIFEEFY